MRVTVSLALVLALLICPAICAADAIGHGAYAHGGAGSPEAPADAEPTPCEDEERCPQESGDNCICRGAVPADSVRIAAADRAVDAPSWFLPPLGDSFLSLLAHLTHDRSPAGPSHMGDPQHARAALQVYRF